MIRPEREEQSPRGSRRSQAGFSNRSTSSRARRTEARRTVSRSPANTSPSEINSISGPAAAFGPAAVFERTAALGPAVALDPSAAFGPSGNPGSVPLLDSLPPPPPASRNPALETRRPTQNQTVPTGFSADPPSGPAI